MARRDRPSGDATDPVKDGEDGEDGGELLSYLDRLSNWGRWGDGDELGTLNYVTAETALHASGLVSTGQPVSCAWGIDSKHQADDVVMPPHLFTFLGPGSSARADADTDADAGGDAGEDAGPAADGKAGVDRGSTVMEYFGLVPHGFRVTHLDAFAHVAWDGKTYGGARLDTIRSESGASRHDVTPAARGVVTRGILLDAAAYRGQDWLEPGEAVTRDELDGMMADAGLEPLPGDALLLRTGYGRKRSTIGPDSVGEVGRAGWHPSCLPWFHDHQVGLVAADTSQDVVPPVSDVMPRPIHTVGITAMGLWLLDNCNLEALAEACRVQRRWEFLFVVAALPLTGATSSPVNPIAVL